MREDSICRQLPQVGAVARRRLVRTSTATSGLDIAHVRDRQRLQNSSRTCIIRNERIQKTARPNVSSSRRCSSSISSNKKPFCDSPRHSGRLRTTTPYLSIRVRSPNSLAQAFLHNSRAVGMPRYVFAVRRTSSSNAAQVDIQYDNPNSPSIRVLGRPYLCIDQLVPILLHILTE